MALLHSFLFIFIGLSGGVAVGSGLVAFLTVLDVLPRLAYMIRKSRQPHFFESAVIVGAVFWTVMDFFNFSVPLHRLGTAVVGTFAGVFVGMLAAALTEVLNVIPIMAKRLGMKKYVLWLMLAMVLGKVIGSLLDWLLF